MKLKTIGYLAVLGMALSSATAWSLAGAAEGRRTDLQEPILATDPAPPATFTGAQFSAGRTLLVDGRLGHSRLLADKQAETYLFLNVSAPSTRARTGSPARAPLNLAIVVDRSGSMKGKRLQNARDAAIGMIQRLSAGDVVSVVAYDRTTEVLVPSTVIDETSKARAIVAVSALRARGETCISCGVEAGERLLQGQSGMVNRLLLLSDGEATAGIQSVDGFRSLATRLRTAGVAVSSIGVDVDYNERTLAVLAQESNGRHHFVENPAALSRAFDAELDSLERTVAKEAEVALDLGPGIEVTEVLDRSFRRESSRVIVPLGTFAEGEQKTVLARVRIARSDVGERAVASVRLAYEDVANRAPGECSGNLALLVTRDASELEPLDSLVAARLQRTETARTLTDANQLFSAGRAGQAQRRIAEKLDDLKRERKTALAAAPQSRAKEIEGDFERQERVLGAAASGFAEPPPAPEGAAGPMKPEALRKGKSQVRSNQKEALDLAF